MARGSELFFYVDKFPKAQNGLGFTTSETQKVDSLILTEGFNVAHCGLENDIYKINTYLGAVAALAAGLSEAAIIGGAVGSALGPVGSVVGVVVAVIGALLISGVFGDKSAWDGERTEKVHKAIAKYYIDNIRIIANQKPTNRVDDEKVFGALNKSLLQTYYMERVFNQLKNAGWRSNVSKDNTANLHTMVKDLRDGIMKKINSMSFFYDIEIKNINVVLDEDLISDLNVDINIKNLDVVDDAREFFKHNKSLTFPMVIVQRKSEYVNGVAIFNDFINADKEEANSFKRAYRQKKEELLEKGRYINELLIHSGSITKEQIEDIARWKSEKENSVIPNLPNTGSSNANSQSSNTQNISNTGSSNNPKNPANTGSSNANSQSSNTQNISNTGSSNNPKNPANTGSSNANSQSSNTQNVNNIGNSNNPILKESEKVKGPVEKQNYTKKIFLGLLLLLILKQKKDDKK